MKKLKCVCGKPNEIVLEQVHLPFGGKWTLEVTETGELFGTNETCKPITFTVKHETITLHTED